MKIPTTVLSKTHRVTFILDNGVEMATDVEWDPEEVPQADDETPCLEQLLDYIDDRDTENWKVVGDMAAFHRRIVGVKCEEL